MKLDVSTERGYDIACTLRGPDTDTAGVGEWKHLVTCVLRHFVGCKSGHGGFVITPQEARASDGAFISRAAALDARWTHYGNHANTAFKHLRSKAAKEYYAWLKEKGLL